MSLAAIAHTNPTGFVGQLMSAAEDLAGKMPVEAPKPVEVEVMRIVHDTASSEWKAVSRGVITKPTVTANRRPTKFGKPWWREVDPAEVVADLFVFDSKAFSEVPDKAVWEVAVALANDPNFGLEARQSSHTLSRALNQLILLRAGAGFVKASELP